MNKELVGGNKLISGFMSLSIISGISNGIFQLIVPLYAISLYATDAQVGFSRGVIQLGSLIVALPSGFLIDKFGSRKIYVFSCIFDIFAIIMVSVSTTLKFFLLVLFLEGIAGSIRWTSVNSAFFEKINYIGNDKSGWVRASMAIGLNFIGPLLGGAIIVKNNYASVFYFIGGLLFLTVFMSIFLKNDQELVNSNYKNKENTLIQIGRLFRNKLLIRTALIQSVIISCFISCSVFIVVFLLNLGYQTNTISVVIASQGVGFILIMFLGGKLYKKISLRSLYIDSVLLVIVGLCIIIFINNIYLIWLGMVLIGIGAGLSTNISYSILGNMKGEKGKISGLFYLFTGTGMAIGPLVGSFMVAVFGIIYGFIVFLPIELFILMFILFIKDDEIMEVH